MSELIGFKKTVILFFSGSLCLTLLMGGCGRKGDPVAPDEPSPQNQISALLR